jgi:CRISPR/Cas system-associated endonuclease/helicase Cas3
LGKTVAVTRLTEKALGANPGARVFYLAPTVAILNQIYGELRKFQAGGSTILLHYLAREFEFELRGDSIVESIALSSSMTELRQV